MSCPIDYPYMWEGKCYRELRTVPVNEEDFMTPADEMGNPVEMYVPQIPSMSAKKVTEMIRNNSCKPGFTYDETSRKCIVEKINTKLKFDGNGVKYICPSSHPIKINDGMFGSCTKEAADPICPNGYTKYANPDWCEISPPRVLSIPKMSEPVKQCNEGFTYNPTINKCTKFAYSKMFIPGKGMGCWSGATEIDGKCYRTYDPIMPQVTPKTTSYFEPEPVLSIPAPMRNYFGDKEYRGASCFSTSVDLGGAGVRGYKDAANKCKANPDCNGLHRNNAGDYWLLRNTTNKVASANESCIELPKTTSYFEPEPFYRGSLFR